jgi:hypothetical protein
MVLKKGMVNKRMRYEKKNIGENETPHAKECTGEKLMDTIKIMHFTLVHLH